MFTLPLRGGGCLLREAVAPGLSVLQRDNVLALAAGRKTLLLELHVMAHTERNLIPRRVGRFRFRSRRVALSLTIHFTGPAA